MNETYDVFDLDVRIDAVPAAYSDRRGAADGQTYSCNCSGGSCITYLCGR